jgi:hypothetical protein
LTIVGSQTGANEAGDKLYPARMRANGLGWALGIGRLGGIAGPALGGDLLAPGLRPPIIFLSACGFILGAAVATALLRFREERVESLTISWPTIPTSITRGLARPEERRSPTRSGKRPASGFDYTLYSQLTLAGPEVRIHLPPAGSPQTFGPRFRLLEKVGNSCPAATGGAAEAQCQWDGCCRDAVTRPCSRVAAVAASMVAGSGSVAAASVGGGWGWRGGGWGWGLGWG